MEQMGNYGLIYPLVATMEKKGTTSHIYLVDGRHRYNGLLQLDLLLKDAIYEFAKVKEKTSTSFTAYHNIPDPRDSSVSIMEKYKPDSENHNGEPPYLVPVKIYLNTNEIETIGMAVFLNKGQKRLSGGEEIEKVAQAFEIALGKSESERKAANDLNSTDPGRVIASWIVAQIMNDPTMQWFEIIGRWQGERTESSKSNSQKLKPLTANNFLIFIRTLINDIPSDGNVSFQRDLEIQNLVRLGNIFYKSFDWPNDIPVSSTKEEDLHLRYTPTSILSRSFVIQAVGTVLNKVNTDEDGRKLLSQNLDYSAWDRIAEQISKIKAEFDRQSNIRVRFELAKKKLKELSYKDPDRSTLVKELDDLRGELWSLDTVTSTLTLGIEGAIGYTGRK